MKHKYLRELFPDGNLPFPYGEVDCADFDARDTFNFNDTFPAWLYERLRYFQDEASKIIDFTFYEFDIDGEMLTQAECIDRMIEDCEVMLLENDTFIDNEAFKKADAAKDDLFKILSKVYWAMWW